MFQTYFKPAMLNIRENNGENSPALDEYIAGIQAQILEEVSQHHVLVQCVM